MKKKKQGEVEEITTQDSEEFKETTVVKKEVASEEEPAEAPVVSPSGSQIITMRNSRPYQVFFDEKGKEVSAEEVVG